MSQPFREYRCRTNCGHIVSSVPNSASRRHRMDGERHIKSECSESGRHRDAGKTNVFDNFLSHTPPIFAKRIFNFRPLKSTTMEKRGKRNTISIEEFDRKLQKLIREVQSEGTARRTTTVIPVPVSSVSYRSRTRNSAWMLRPWSATSSGCEVAAYHATVHHFTCAICAPCATCFSNGARSPTPNFSPMSIPASQRPANEPFRNRRSPASNRPI